MSKTQPRPQMTLAEIAASLDLTGQRFATYSSVPEMKPLDAAELDEMASWMFRMAHAVRFCSGEIAGVLAPAPNNVIPLRNDPPAALPSPVDSEPPAGQPPGAEGGAS